MTEDEYKRIGELLKRRDQQREYAKAKRKSIAETQRYLKDHTNIIAIIERELLTLGYTGQ